MVLERDSLICAGKKEVQMWWPKPAIPALRILGQEDCYQLKVNFLSSKCHARTRAVGDAVESSYCTLQRFLTRIGLIKC